MKNQFGHNWGLVAEFSREMGRVLVNVFVNKNTNYIKKKSDFFITLILENPSLHLLYSLSKVKEQKEKKKTSVT